MVTPRWLALAWWSLLLTLPAAASQIALAWNDNSSNETSFKIERALADLVFTQVATVGTNVSVYIDTTVSPSTTYRYRVCASNASGNSAYSNVITATTPAASNTAPVISNLANTTIGAGSSTTALAFTVSDAETVAGSLVVTGASSNTALVPNSAIVFGGSGSNRTVTVTPAAAQAGTATITVTVNDGVLATSTSFSITVNPANTAPAISNLANTTISAGSSTGALAFTASDAETAAGSLVVTGASSNAALVPNSAIVFGGGGSNRTVTVTPAAAQTGNATITVTVSDGTLTVSDTFMLTVVGGATATLLNGAVISSAPFDNNPAYQGANAFDGNGATFFASRLGDAFVYVGRDLGQAGNITRIRYLPRPGFAARMNGGRFRAANAANMSDAVTLHTITFNPPEGVWQDVFLAVPATGYRYVFFTTSFGNYGDVAELAFHGSLSAPQITGQPQSQTITEGNPVVFAVGASGSNSTYQWFKNGLAVAGATSATYAIGTVLGVDAGSYNVVVTNAGGSVTSSMATLTVVGVTTATLLNGAVISSAPYDNNPAYQGANAFDGNGATFFASRLGDAFVYVGRDLGQAKTITRIRYLPRAGFAARMNGARFRGANAADLSDAVTLHTIAFTPPEGVFQEVVLAEPVTRYRYVFFTTSYENNGNVAELEFHGPGG